MRPRRQQRGDFLWQVLESAGCSDHCNRLVTPLCLVLTSSDIRTTWVPICGGPPFLSFFPSIPSTASGPPSLRRKIIYCTIQSMHAEGTVLSTVVDLLHMNDNKQFQSNYGNFLLFCPQVIDLHPQPESSLLPL